jgi:hypothetical protein
MLTGFPTGRGNFMKVHTTCAAALLVSAALTSAGHAASVTLQPGEDTSKDVFVYAFTIPGTLGIPTPPNSSNFDTESVPAGAAVPFGTVLGAAETEPFRNDPTDPTEPLRAHTTRSLLAFDLSSVAATVRRVGKATLNLVAVPGLPPFDNASPGTPVNLAVKRVLEDWDEQTVTWDTRPEVGDISDMFELTGVPTKVSFDVTDLVRDWLTNPSSNFGFEVSQIGLAPNPQGPGERDRFAVALFTSSGFADPSLRPSLTVAAVPLPATLPMLIAGAGLLATLRRRRRA